LFALFSGIGWQKKEIENIFSFLFSGRTNVLRGARRMT
jgi:hypothetical protein